MRIDIEPLNYCSLRAAIIERSACEALKNIYKLLDKKRKVYGNNKAVNTSINNFKTLPKFGYYSGPENTQTAEEILKELGY